MTDFVLKHFKHPGHTSVVATGVAISGPSADGFVHVTFYRDMLSLIEEYFDAHEEGEGVNKTATLVPKREANKTEMGREDVATVLIPAAAFESFYRTFGQMAELLPERIEKPKQGH